MVTTIQVKETTKQLLEKVKHLEQAETYDQVLTVLLSERLKIPVLFGMTRKKPLGFTKEDELKFHEL